MNIDCAMWRHVAEKKQRRLNDAFHSEDYWWTYETPGFARHSETGNKQVDSAAEGAKIGATKDAVFKNNKDTSAQRRSARGCRWRSRWLYS